MNKIASNILLFPENPRSLHKPYGPGTNTDGSVTDLNEYKIDQIIDKDDRILTRIGLDKYMVSPIKSIAGAVHEYSMDDYLDFDAKFAALSSSIVNRMKEEKQEVLRGKTEEYDAGFKDSSQGKSYVLRPGDVLNRLRSHGLYIVFNPGRVEYLRTANQLRMNHLNLMEEI